MGDESVRAEETQSLWGAYDGGGTVVTGRRERHSLFTSFSPSSLRPPVSFSLSDLTVVRTTYLLLQRLLLLFHTLLTPFHIKFINS